jgi:predicted PhzF superfamily epimerase YddE/YHI9
VQVQFVTVDVFTDRQFGGNPLAVVLDARGLATAQMQAIASEFNLAETTFVLPPKDPRNTAHVRIFTPKAEMPFAGHPNVGTAFVLARLGHVCGQPIGGFALAFEEIAGLVHLELIGQGVATTGARLSAPNRSRSPIKSSPNWSQKPVASQFLTLRRATMHPASQVVGFACCLRNSNRARPSRQLNTMRRFSARTFRENT